MKKQTNDNDAPGIQASDENELRREQNHNLITDALLLYYSEFGVMPSKTVLAERTGLSRPTIVKHMRDIKHSDIYKAELESYNMLAGRVVSQLFRSALSGDLQAAKLFLETVKPAPEKNANTQNNYLQINKTVINQQVIQQLKPEKQKRIEAYITREIEDETED